jgi:tetratricopeptide (TPR) repeat protein
MGLHETAHAVLEETSAQAHALRLPRLSQNALQNLGLVFLRQGKLGDAERALTESARLFERDGRADDLCFSLCYLALVRAAAGEHGAAAELAARALSLTALSPRAHALALATSARTAMQVGQHERARAHSAQAMELQRQHDLFEHENMLRLAYAEAHRDHMPGALAAAHQWLLACAARISEPSWRRAFLERVPENARIVQLAAGAPPEGRPGAAGQEPA